MSVISVSHLALVRARKALEQAYDTKNWDDVRELDSLLGECLNQAFDDDQRDTSALVSELERVLKLYAAIVSSLPEQAEQLSFSGANMLSVVPPCLE
ncbi:hypothetical protein [Teredinibacter purpureus]|uniref:hypothetical protein n=1 Tax=Teredinibacter purpureus TaxID=2731756 RepID=UPI0005F88609|nr:hypothetical protein [Teredinibacter purpureus]